jgi:single-stranded DNA-binding protein
MGRICHDLELKATPSGVSVMSFRIAVDRSYQVKGEERKADFFNIVAWRNTAEFIAKYFGKGRMIMLDGELQTRQYVDKDNVTRDIAYAPFSINPEKTRYGSAAERNWNLGLMLNNDNQITIGHKRKKEFKAMLDNYIRNRKSGSGWERHDIQVANLFRSAKMNTCAGLNAILKS